MRIIQVGKQATNRCTWLEKRACVSQHPVLLVLSADPISAEREGSPRNSSSLHRSWSLVFGEITNSVSQKGKKDHFYRDIPCVCTLGQELCGSKSSRNKTLGLYSFPRDAIKMCHKLGALKQ